MTALTVAPAYTATTMPTCELHEGDACIQLKLTDEPAGEELSFMFTTFRPNNEPTHIGIIDDLLLECRPFRSPTGFKLVDNKTVHFHFGLGTHHVVLGEARERLRQRVARRVSESNTTHKRDPQTRLVTPR